jgi:chromosome segregation ATPase
MDQDKLRADLEALHAELKQTDAVETEQRELLQKLSTDIQRLLTQTDAPDEQYPGLNKQLKDAVAELEASHPRITLLMRHVIDSLSYLGI